MDEKRKVTQEELDNACLLHNKHIEDEGGERAVFENFSFERLSFKGKQFNNAVFRNCEFRLCDMTDKGMCFAELNNVRFSGCDCNMFTAEEAAFRNVTFDKCDLRFAVFTHSSLRNIAFDKCETDGMSMQNCCELPEAEIIRVSPEELRKMSNKEGLILQGCGGDLQEWADGINSTLADADILKSPFEKLYVFENEGQISCSPSRTLSLISERWQCGDSRHMGSSVVHGSQIMPPTGSAVSLKKSLHWSRKSSIVR